MSILMSITASVALAVTGAAAPEPPVEGTHWVIEAVTDVGGTAPIPATPEAYLELAEGQLDGFTGCNWVSGYAEVGDGTVVISGFGTTKRGCSDYPESLEYRMQWVLDDGDSPAEFSADVECDTLTLTRADGRGALHLRAAP
jgi:heat shock protein HslJ